MKVAVSIPDPVFEAAERLAKQRRVPRSQLFAEALQDYLSRCGAETVTAKLNEVYGVENSQLDTALADAQYGALTDEAW